MSISADVSNLCEKLKLYSSEAISNPALTEMARENCLGQIKLAEILASAKEKTTPLSTHMMFQSALKQQLPNEVKQILLREEF